MTRSCVAAAADERRQVLGIVREVGVHLADEVGRALRDRVPQAVDVRAAESARAGAVHDLDAARDARPRAGPRSRPSRPATRRRRPAAGSRRAARTPAAEQRQVLASRCSRRRRPGRVACSLMLRMPRPARPAADDQRRIDHGNPEPLLRKEHEAGSTAERPASHSAAGGRPAPPRRHAPAIANGSSSRYGDDRRGTIPRRV